MQDRLSNMKNVDKMNVETTEASSVEDNYMDSLSDIDIIDAIVNPEGWSEEDLVLAREISKQRDLKPTARLIQSLQKDKDAINKPKFTKQKTLISQKLHRTIIYLHTFLSKTKRESQEDQHFGGK